LRSSTTSCFQFHLPESKSFPFPISAAVGVDLD
jgi:hypothetical protein